MCIFFVLVNKGLCLFFASVVAEEIQFCVCVFVSACMCVCVCVAVTCRWHTCHFKAPARCESRGTGYTGIHSGRYPHSSVALFTHNNYTCINIMAGAHYNAANQAAVPHLHLWSHFDGPASRIRAAALFKFLFICFKGSFQCGYYKSVCETCAFLCVEGKRSICII